MGRGIVLKESERSICEIRGCEFRSNNRNKKPCKGCEYLANFQKKLAGLLVTGGRYSAGSFRGAGAKRSPGCYGIYRR
jgi:hypothetical protein